MNLAVVGSRTFCDREFVENIMQQMCIDYLCPHPNNCFISGGAIGVDSWAENLATKNGIKTKIYLPDWTLHGKSAGFIRNKQIIDAADFILAFWDGKSKGTKISIDLALASHKPINIYVRE